MHNILFTEISRYLHQSIKMNILNDAVIILYIKLKMKT